MENNNKVSDKNKNIKAGPEDIEALLEAIKEGKNVKVIKIEGSGSAEELFDVVRSAIENEIGAGGPGKKDSDAKAPESEKTKALERIARELNDLADTDTHVFFASRTGSDSVGTVGGTDAGVAKTLACLFKHEDMPAKLAAAALSQTAVENPDGLGFAILTAALGTALDKHPERRDAVRDVLELGGPDVPTDKGELLKWFHRRVDSSATFAETLLDAAVCLCVTDDAYADRLPHVLPGAMMLSDKLREAVKGAVEKYDKGIEDPIARLVARLVGEAVEKFKQEKADSKDDGKDDTEESGDGGSKD